MIRSTLAALALSAVAGATAQAQYPFAPPHQHQHPRYPVPVPVYTPPPAYVVRHAPPVYSPPVYTMDDFVKCFRPTEGHHRIYIVHPRTNRPVEVCFTLPCGRLREVEVNRNSIEFDYSGARDVEIVFRGNGTVDVRN